MICLGGKGGQIAVLSPQYKVLVQLDLNVFIQEGQSNHIRSIAVGEKENELFVSTYGSEIYRLYSDS